MADANRNKRQYQLDTPEGKTVTIEYIVRDDWDGMTDPCPSCSSTEFIHVKFEGGHYGLKNEAIILRTDFWDQKGALFTECGNCSKVLFKHPAYDILQEDCNFPSVE